MTSGIAATGAKRNTAIELWRFFASVIILGYHISVIFPMLTGGKIAASNWLAGGGEVLFIFTLTSGYFLISHFKGKAAREDGYAALSCSGRAWDYLKGRLKALLPVLAVGVALGIVSVAVYQMADPATIAYQVVNGLWEFLGCYALGFTAAFGQANGALWFISALFACSYLLYFMLCKNEDLTVGIFAPVVFFVLEGWWCKTGIRASQQAWSTVGSIYYANNMAVNGSGESVGVMGVNNGLVFVLVGMCGGMMLYYAVERLKKVDFSAGARALMSVVYAVVAAVLCAYMINPTWFGSVGLDRMTVHLLCIVLIGLTMLQKDAVSQALNSDKVSGALSYLGGISLYVYMVHQPMIYFSVVLLGRDGTYSFNELFLPVLIASLVLSVVIKLLMDRNKKAKSR